MVEAQCRQKRRRNRKKRNTTTDTEINDICSSTSSARTVKLRADAPAFVPTLTTGGDEARNRRQKSRAPPKRPKSNRRSKNGRASRQRPQHNVHGVTKDNLQHTESDKLVSPTNIYDSSPEPELEPEPHRESFSSLAAFPALHPSVEFPMATASLSTPTAWTQAPKIAKRVQEDGNEEDRQESWGHGLEQLSSPSFKAISMGNCRNASREKNGGYSKNGEDHSKETAHSSQHNDFVAPPVTSPLNRRKRIDMNKLRDRWWSVMEQRRRQAAFREELCQRLEPLKIDPVVIHDDSARDDETDTSKEQFDTNMCVAAAEEGDCRPCSECHQQQPSCATATCIAGRGVSLHDIIDRNDESALLQLLSLECEKERYSHLIENATMIAVNTNRPRLLRVILTNLNAILVEEASFRRRLFATAVELGFEECVSVFVSNQHRGENLLLCTDDRGNNVFHACVRGLGSDGLLKLLLEHVPGSNKGKQQQLSKLLLSKNGDSLTPFHEACRCNRPSMVDAFLATCNASLLARILSTKDADSQTPLLTAVANNASEIVLSLIMWRGNHIPASRKNKFSSACNRHLRKKEQSSSQPSCPLVWAGKMGKLNMIDLLLQFGGQSGSSYQVTDALHHLLRSSVSIQIKLEGSEMLLFAGANPFAEGYTAALSVAVTLCSPDIIHSLVSNGKKMLQNLQLARRRDPVLRQQPESFFRTIESKENFGMKKATTMALIKSLLFGFQSRLPVYFASADALYANGVTLETADLYRLSHAMTGNELNCEVPAQAAPSFQAVYDFEIPPALRGSELLKLRDLEYDRAPLSCKSKLLRGMKWIRNENCHCPWLSEKLPSEDGCPPPHDDEVVLVSDDGSQFTVNESIIAQKSPKLQSAIRFQRMNTEKDATKWVPVPIPSTHLQCMIQHFYHGSIFCWPSLPTSGLCHFLLELFLIAEEYLCLDLMMEIEMRFLSSDPRACFCWFCCQAVKVHPVDGSMAQCMYCVDGKSSLLDENIFQVMSLVEVIETPQYSLQVMSASTKFHMVQDQRGSWSGGTTVDAFAALKDTIRVKVLCDFGKIRNDIHGNTNSDEPGSNDTTEAQKILLLQMCVNDLQNSSIVATFDSAGIESMSSVAT